MFDRIGRCIDNDDQGLLTLRIVNYADKNRLEEWALSQLQPKAAFIKQIRINYLSLTTAENRSVLLNLVASLCAQTDSCLETL